MSTVHKYCCIGHNYFVSEYFLKDNILEWEMYQHSFVNIGLCVIHEYIYYSFNS